jgi:AraC family transcriptional regulator
MFKKLVFLLVSCLVVFIVTLFYRLGGHKSVSIERIENPQPIALLGHSHIGPYHKINTVITMVESWANQHNLPCLRSFGEYYDDPRTKDEARLRSFGGCVLDGIESLSLSEKPPEGFEIKTLPIGSYVVAKFEGSPSIGPMKVYPKVQKWLDEQGLIMDGSVIEMYTIKGDRDALTEYFFKFKNK